MGILNSFASWIQISRVSGLAFVLSFFDSQYLFLFCLFAGNVLRMRMSLKLAGDSDWEH